MGYRAGLRPDSCGTFERVRMARGRLSGWRKGKTVSWKRLSWRSPGWRRAVPAVVAATAVAGVAAGAGVTAFSGQARDAAGGSAGPQRVVASSGSFATQGQRRGSGATPVASPIAGLPSAKPVTEDASIMSYLPSTAVTLDAKIAPAAAAPSAPAVAPLRGTRRADLLVVAPFTLRQSLVTALGRAPDVAAAEPVEAFRVKANGTYTAMLGVDPSGFRSFAAKSAATSDALWRGVAGGGIAVSFTMGKLDKLPLGGMLTVTGRTSKRLRVAAFGTMGVSGVDGVVSHSVARALGAPAGNAIVISVRGTGVSSAASAVSRLLPKGVAVQQLVSVAPSGHPGSGPAGTGAGAGTSAQGWAGASATSAMLTIAMRQLGIAYVWGGTSPTQGFDCSGIVDYSFRLAGITMPRVAADQALTGPAVPVNQLRPGDLLFYHTDATDPNYISHVAIYLGRGYMLQAPRPGLTVEMVPAAFGSEFAGAVRVNPAQAAAVAARVA
jgi:peptidoglycan DL-endopeptidase CwlO